MAADKRVLVADDHVHKNQSADKCVPVAISECIVAGTIYIYIYIYIQKHMYTCIHMNILISMVIYTCIFREF
jgi:hypothetical protein